MAIVKTITAGLGGLLEKSIRKVNLYFSVDRGNNWVQIAQNIDNNGQYNWLVPESIKKSKNCLVKVESTDSVIKFDTPEKVFTIK